MQDLPKVNLIRVKAELCRRTLAFFVKEFWEIIIQDPIVWNWHMDVLCDEVQQVYERVIKRQQKLYDLIINIPPGTSKSTIATVMAPVWSWTRDQGLRHITASYSDSLSTEHAVKSRDIVRSDKFRLYFPEIEIKKDEDNKTNYKTLKGGQRFATSVTGTITGTHAHIQTIDDPLNPKQAASDAELETANNFFSHTLSTRKVDKEVTPMILIMQRLAVNDCTGYLLSKGKDNVRKVCLPAQLSKDVSPEEYKDKYINGLLDPVRLGESVLREMKIDLGSAGFAGQMGQQPVPPGGLILKEQWFEVVDKAIPSSALIYFQLDTAYTKDQDNDPTALTAYYKEGSDVYIISSESNWFEFPELIKWLAPRVRNLGYSDQSIVRVEPKASGKSIVQQLKQDSTLNIVESEAPEKDKISRCKNASPKIEAGRVKLHRGPWNKAFIDQCCSFPKGQHDDELDNLTEIVRNELLQVEQEWVFMDM